MELRRQEGDRSSGIAAEDAGCVRLDENKAAPRQVEHSREIAAMEYAEVVAGVEDLQRGRIVAVLRQHLNVARWAEDFLTSLQDVQET
jgi:hypothetical protein